MSGPNSGQLEGRTGMLLEGSWSLGALSSGWWAGQTVDVKLESCRQRRSLVVWGGDSPTWLKNICAFTQKDDIQRVCGKPSRYRESSRRRPGAE